MIKNNQFEKMLLLLENPNTNIINKNKLALSLAETKDIRVLNVLHQLILNDNNKNYRGTFVYALQSFPSSLSFNIAIDLIMYGNFEVAHEAFLIINNAEDIEGDNVKKAYMKLSNFQKNNHWSDDWRENLINDSIEMFR